MPNEYYQEVFKRRNLLKEGILTFFYGFSSYPKMFLEVFIRKNLGERYFSLATVITGAIVLIVFPLVQFGVFKLIQFQGGFGEYDPNQESVSSITGDFLLKYLTWYVFIVLFLIVSARRWKEVKANPSIIDGGRFTMSSGDIDDRFYEVKLFGKYPTTRQVEILVEPALFFMIGIVLKFFGQSVGTFLIISSIFYCLSYARAYKVGDDLIMDKLDEIKMNQDMEDVLIHDRDNGKKTGNIFRAHRPTSQEMRESLFNALVKSDKEEEVAAM